MGAFNKEVSVSLNSFKYISFSYLVFRMVALDYFLLWALLYMEKFWIILDSKLYVSDKQKPHDFSKCLKDNYFAAGVLFVLSAINDLKNVAVPQLFVFPRQSFISYCNTFTPVYTEVCKKASVCYFHW